MQVFLNLVTDMVDVQEKESQTKTEYNYKLNSFKHSMKKVVDKELEDLAGDEPKKQKIASSIQRGPSMR